MPPFLSARFHLRYFPALIWSRIRPRAEEPRAGFANHGSLEYSVILMACAIAVAVAVPLAVQGSVIGVIVAGLGVLGIAAMLILSVSAARGTYAGFEAFRIWVFFFFAMLGLTLGMFFGTLEHSTSRSVLYGAAGLAVGYPIAIAAGLFVQRLGWIAGMLDGLAMLALFGMVVVDIMLLFL